MNDDIIEKPPEKTSRWTDAERERDKPQPDVAPPIAPAAPPPPRWLPAFQRDTLIQHNGWWARIKGYGQNEDGDIGCFIVPYQPTRGATKKGTVPGL